MHLAGFDLSSWLATSAALVVPSPLFASVAERQVEQHMLAAGISSWERPPIHTVEAWLVRSWEEARYSQPDIPTLLSPAQELAVWRQLIEAEYATLFDLNATASLCRHAARLVAEWKISLEHESWAESGDAKEFLRWYKLFRQRCRAENWVARSDLWSLSSQWTAAAAGDSSARFHGFESISPALAKLGAKRTDQRAGARPSPFLVTEYPDAASELTAAARWTRLHFEQHAAQSFAVFVPALHEQQSLVERTFEDVFYPSGSPLEGSSVYHLTASPTLDQHPLIRGALLILELAKPRIAHADAEALLRSPYLAGAGAERHARARADIRLRSARELDVSLYEMERASRDCPQLASVWTRVRDVLQGKPKFAELSTWGKFIADLLRACGWPGDFEPTVDEQEVVELWQRSLTGLAALGLVMRATSFDQAMFHLGRLLGESGPASGDWSSPIQILDLSEAQGLHFDHAFVTGLSEGTWPPRRTLSPFIPLPLQRAHRVPGSDRDSVIALAEGRTVDLLACAPSMTGTYSERLSPYLRGAVNLTKTAASQWTGKTPIESFEFSALETIEDTYAPAYNVSEQSRGGTGLLKAQSACPFKAFAEIRLNARDPNAASFGFDAMERGNFIHKALELVWKQLGSWERLQESSSEDLLEMLDTVLDRVVICDDRDSELNRQTSLTERHRLADLLLEWLNVERARLRPFTVQTVEQERTISFEGLILKVRIDRTDRLPDGKLLLIDYKSGKQFLKKLEGDRPDEPQLLVYASALDEPVDGIFFAQVKPRAIELMGYSRDPQHPSRAVKSKGGEWDSFLRDREQVVRSLARQFVSGYAAVDPVKAACKYCGLQSLCRISEKRVQEEAD